MNFEFLKSSLFLRFLNKKLFVRLIFLFKYYWIIQFLFKYSNPHQSVPKIHNNPNNYA
ncbi:hypothetical protein Mapa_018911 [Marchantia paleacea]|nr:hypothetical protein Mapa_018911 [Marchantia paleacea]